MYKNSLLGFLMLFCHVFIYAPEKLPKFGAFTTLGTALVREQNQDLSLATLGMLIGLTEEALCNFKV